MHDTQLPAESPTTGCRVRLDPTVLAPRTARRLTRQICAGLPIRTVDNAALVVGELVTSSVRQSRSPVDLDLRACETGVTISVFDAVTLGPELHPASFGRCRRVLDAASSAWGCRRTATGRVLWAEIRTEQ